MSDARDLRVAFIGDSFVAGIGDPEARGWVGRVASAADAAGIPLSAYNLGVRRETSADILRRWQAEAIVRLPSTSDGRVVFSLGANDATFENGRARVEPEASAANLDRMLAGAAALGLPAFVVGTVPAGDAAHRERIDALSMRLEAVAVARAVPYVDVREAIVASDVWRREVRKSDGIHPRAGGYELLASVIAGPLLRWLAAEPR